MAAQEDMLICARLSNSRSLNSLVPAYFDFMSGIQPAPSPYRSAMRRRVSPFDPPAGDSGMIRSPKRVCARVSDLVATVVA
jgi:hypothetical protein